MTTPQEARSMVERLRNSFGLNRIQPAQEAAAMLTEYADMLERQAQPIGIIRDGSMFWYIPEPTYSIPEWVRTGTHLLYAAPKEKP